MGTTKFHTGSREEENEHTKASKLIPRKRREKSQVKAKLHYTKYDIAQKKKKKFDDTNRLEIKEQRLLFLTESQVDIHSHVWYRSHVMIGGDN